MHPDSLPRKIGFYGAVSFIVGSIIGAGVFMKPSAMAAQLGSPVWLTLVWIIAGVFTLFGALIFAELGGMMPQTGGAYVFFRKIYGEFTGFLYGWAAFSVVNTASIAAISFVCAEYFGHIIALPRLDPAIEQSFRLQIPFLGNILPLENLGVKSLAIFFLLSLTALNYRSVKGGNYFQVVSTFIKILVMVLLVLGIFFSGRGDAGNFFQAEHPASGGDLLSGIVLAMTGAFFAYDGWINATYIAGEIKHPQRNVPASLFLGVFICIGVYVLVNQAYLYAMPVEQIARSPLVASDAIERSWGRGAGTLVAALIVICTFGAINGNTMATSRVTYAMSGDGMFLPWAGRTHPRFRTPGNALLLHCAWSGMLILSGSFNMLADMFVFMTWLCYLFGAIGVIILRKRQPGAERPYKVWGYPLVPWIFLLFTAFYLVITVESDIRGYASGQQPVINSLLGLAITALGIPVYFIFRKRGLKNPS